MEQPRPRFKTCPTQFPEYNEWRTSKRTKKVDENKTGSSSDDLSVQTPEEALETAMTQIVDDLASEILEQVKVMPPFDFERLVLDLMVSMGYGGAKDAASLTRGGADEGIDGIINEDQLGLDIVYLQAKRWKAQVGRPEIQKFVGALHGKQARKGVFMSTSTFSKEAADYKRAEPLLVEVHDIVKRTLGEDDPSYANSVNNLAVFYNSRGDYNKAEPLLVESLKIRKRVFGEEHPDYGEGLLNLADCCYAMGNHNRAESLYLELRNIRKRVMGGGSFGFTGTDQGETNGIVIIAIEKEGAAGKAGLQIGDRVVAVAGKATGQLDEWGAATSGKKPGDKVSLTIHRDNRSVEKNVVVGEHPQHDITTQRLASFYTTQFEYKKAEPILAGQPVLQTG